MRKRDQLYGYLFITPALVGLMIFLFIPMIMAFYLGFYQWSMVGSMKWIGLRNFQKMFSDELWWTSLWNTVKFVLWVVPFQFILSLALAIFVNRKVRGIGFIRTSCYLPVVTSVIVVSIVWMFVYDPSWGLLNFILRSIGLPKMEFLTSFTQALPSVSAVVIWRALGFYMIIFLAGLQDIPNEYYEAALIDGANKWQSFAYITFPLLKYASFFIFLLQVINAFRIFGEVYVMTRGGPANATHTMVLYIYNAAFRMYKMGYAAAMAVVLFVLLLVLTLIQLRVFRSAFR